MQVEQAGPVLEQTLLQALSVGAEGLMLKFLDSRCAYQPSKRSDSWLKLKKDYCEGLRDSLDLVCIIRDLPSSCCPVGCTFCLWRTL